MTTTSAASGPSRARKVLSALSFRQASALWVLVVIIVVFSITIPETFLSPRVWSSLLDTNTVVTITAIGLVIPLAAGAFNLAVGAQVGFASMFVAWMLVPAGMPLSIALPATVLVGALIGLVAGVLIVYAHIDSFIATLGISSLLAAAVTLLSGGRQILDMPRELSDFGAGRVFGLTYAFIVMLVLAVIAWYVLERTPLGRRIYATGGNIEAARLSGVRVGAVVIGSLVACGVLTSVSGILITARLTNADPTIGPGYLLPAFTAAFLGATQFRGGRFNIWGTVLSVYVLALGVKGLQLSGAPSWISDVFNGVALLVAVGLASAARLGGRRSLLDRLRRRHAVRESPEAGTIQPPSSSGGRVEQRVHG
ncbi:ABC transporter permease [Microbacterium sp. RD1]|uniref:ABC transporter permease n=1 Tax=Microbacterium sp. RD1 TaxID=3457313 RepID=UPI003FA5F489